MRGGGGTKPTGHPKILIKYVALHPMAVSENYSSSGMITIFIKAQTVSILRNIVAGKLTHIVSKRTR